MYISWSRIVVTQIIIAHLLHKLWCTLQNWRFYPLVPSTYMLPLFWTPKTLFKTRWNQSSRTSFRCEKPTKIPEIWQTQLLHCWCWSFKWHLLTGIFTETKTRKNHHKVFAHFKDRFPGKKKTNVVFSRGKGSHSAVPPDCPKHEKTWLSHQSHPKNTRVFWLCFLIFLLSFAAPILQTSTSTSKMP